MSSSAGNERKVVAARRGRLPIPVKPVDYRFGAFELRPAARQLLIEGHPAAIGARAFDVLVVIVERHGQLVTKDEIFELVWPGLFVEENNLQVQVSTLRRLLGQDAIVTVAGHGYRFIPEPTEVPAAPPPSRVVKHNLPARLTSFVGREDDLVHVRTLLSLHRCVTLTGVGGIGKTRLAVELASTLADAYEHGAWFVDLAPICDPHLVAGAVASALGVHPEGDRPVIDALRQFVADRKLLLVLDNCEHVVAACARLATDLLRAGRGITLLATSREPLQFAGEALVSLPSLPAPGPDFVVSPEELSGWAASQLFIERALATNPGFAITASNAAAVARICHDLDGIPLAIELAAARVRAMSVEAIAAHLTDRFRLLKNGSATSLPRQQTLRGAIDWSYEMLAPADRRVFQRLAAFSGGFALEAAMHVGAGGDVGHDDVLELVGRLVDKSLVVFDPKSDRYRMLETVRQYALERLEASGEQGSVRDRHLDFYVKLGAWARPELDGRGAPACCARLDSERENILLAFAHAREAPHGGAGALSMIFDYLSWLSFKDLELWHRVTLDVLGWPDTQVENTARSRALCTVSFLALLRGQYTAAHGLAEESVRIARGCGDRFALAEGLYNLAMAAMSLGRPHDARVHSLEGLDLARGGSDTTLTGVLFCGLGESYSHLGDFERAESAFLQTVAECPEGPQLTAIVLSNLARNAIAMSAVGKALHYLREATAAAEPQAAVTTTLALLFNAAGVAALRGECARAVRLYGAGAAFQARNGIQGMFADAPFYERSIALAREKLGEAASRAASAEGAALDTDAAVAETLAWLDSLPSDVAVATDPGRAS